jgi:D-alanyl-D-alanine carboxypeptidase
MKTLKLAFIALALTSLQAQAVDSYAPSFEDTEEFLTPQSLPAVSPLETWSYKFELINADGTTSVLNSLETNVLLKPASTMKLFTGWWAFQNSNRSDTYLSKMLHESVNSMAENTLQRMGGVLAMQDYYIENGLAIDETNFIAVDGSGLSYDNKTNCETEIGLLKIIKADKKYYRFKKLLAQPNKTGTLQKRLTSLAGKVFAKTGTLNRTASLSGFLETKKGTVVFCVLSDYLNTSVATARKKIDAMVKKNYLSVK